LQNGEEKIDETLTVFTSRVSNKCTWVRLFVLQFDNPFVVVAVVDVVVVVALCPSMNFFSQP